MLLKTPFNHAPVHNVPECGYVFGAAVLVVQVVGMFPNVEAQQRDVSVAYGVVSVGLLYDDKGAVLLHGQPCPSRAKEVDGTALKLQLEVGKRVPLLADGLGQSPARLAAALWRELLKVKPVVQHLPGVFLQAAGGGAVDVFEWQLLKARAADGMVHIVDVGSQVFAVVKLHGLSADGRFEGMARIGKGSEHKAPTLR